jgi:hypothetical protein
MAQALLERHTGDFIEKGRVLLLFEGSQPLGQRIGRETALLGLISVDPQAQRPIVHIAHTAKCACQNLLLFFCRVKPILVGTFLPHKSRLSLSNLDPLSFAVSPRVST